MVFDDDLRYGIARGEILDTDGAGGGELAVRLAIGETQIIQENKDYFSAHGVDIDVLESSLSQSKSTDKKKSTSTPIERSTTTLLIKNLPHDVKSEEIQEMFSRFGAIHSLLLPPSKTVALIDFVEPSDARKAFAGLAYRRYHHVPLYLEWAPTNTIKRNFTTSNTNPSTTLNTNDPNPPKKKRTESASHTSQPGIEAGAGPPVMPKPSTSSAKEAHSLEDESADYSTLYVKNLNFQTTEDDLRRHLTNKLGINASDIRTISIPKKQAKNGEPISMGYGFIEFTSIQGAVKMVGRINGSSLHEHLLEVKASNKRLSVPQQSLIKKSTKGRSDGTDDGNPNETNKLIVRNVAFQATKDELKTLFSAFGTIKTLRIPRKIGGVHRGFAFIDYNTKQEATRAMNSLKRTHLYGRHLVIEYAKNDEDIDEKEKLENLREKAEKNVKTVLKNNRKRKVGDILDSQGQIDGNDLMMA
jgi:multiple RNA-binding domain-containing protein 1